MEPVCAAPFVDKGIVVDFSSPDVRTKASVEDTDYESHISHLDILVFKAGDGSLFWHERVSISAAEGSHTLKVSTGYFAQKDGDVISHPEYNVHVLANCAFDMEFSEAGRSLSVSSSEGELGTYYTESTIGDIVQKDPNLHLSGLNVPSAPSSFLMHSVAKAIHLSDEDPEKNIVIKADLERAAAKVIINIMEGSNIEFTEGADLATKGLFDMSERGLYYIRNLPYCTTLFPKAEILTDASRLHTTPKTNSSHFTWNPAAFSTDTTRVKTSDAESDVVTIVAYVYEHSWSDAGVFENEPVAVVNLPLIYVEEEGGDFHYHAHADSWYKIPLSKSRSFVRNNCYKVNVKINYAGATTVMDPIVVPDIEYEVQDYADGNVGWKTQTISISQSARPKYLTISDTMVEMYSDTVDESVRFSSSAPVRVTIDECYYLDMYGNKTTMPTGSEVSVAAPESLTGVIRVESKAPTNNTPRYINIRVSNGEVEDKILTVVQYPLEYITNTQSYYSYREDFGGTTYEKYDSDRRVAATNYNESTGTWQYEQDGRNDYMFASKVAKPQSDGKSKIYYYQWNVGWWNRVSLYDSQILSGLENGRMYHVKLASSSAEYNLGIPKLDSRGWTDSGSDNENLVSPSFMIASQLGATQSPSSMEEAASHCYNYVETYKDASGNVVHLKDWRLPTKAEINIIIRFQYVPDAVIYEVLSGPNYWSASGSVPNPQSDDAGGTMCAVRCIRNNF